MRFCGSPWNGGCPPAPSSSALRLEKACSQDSETCRSPAILVASRALRNTASGMHRKVVAVPVCTCCGVLRQCLGVSGGTCPGTVQAGPLDCTQLEHCQISLPFRQHGPDLTEPLKTLHVGDKIPSLERGLGSIVQSFPAPQTPSTSHPGTLCPTRSPAQPCLDLCPWGICLPRRCPFPEGWPLASFIPEYLLFVPTKLGPLLGAT